MVKESLALLRVGQWADLPEEELHQYLDLASEVESEILEELDHPQGLVEEEYFEFLNDYVLSDSRVVDQLESANIEKAKLEEFREGAVPVSKAYSKQYKIHYGLDKVADFVMMMKFIDDYTLETGEPGIAPRNRLQYLLYLVNYKLSKKNDLRPESMRTDLGNLEHTGYRYTFNKAQSGPFSSKLYKDKNRLFANRMLDEVVVNSSISEHDEPYRISLGDVGERVFARYREHFSNFDSVLMTEWNLRQKEVLEEYASLTHSELKDEIQSMSEFQSTDEGRELLEGRPRDFDEVTPVTSSVFEVAALVQ